MSDKRRASVERIAGAQLASMNGTMADAVGQSNRQRMVWLSLLAALSGCEMGLKLAGVKLQGSGVAAAMEVLQHSATCQARYPG